MSNHTLKSLTIELNYYNAEDAIRLLKKITRNNINLLGSRIVQTDESYMKIKMAYSVPLVEPKIKTINGVECFVYQSSMNK